MPLRSMGVLHTQENIPEWGVGIGFVHQAQMLMDDVFGDYLIEKIRMTDEFHQKGSRRSRRVRKLAAAGDGYQQISNGVHRRNSGRVRISLWLATSFRS